MDLKKDREAFEKKLKKASHAVDNSPIDGFCSWTTGSLAMAEQNDPTGGALPEISQKTYAAIMEKLDTFAASFEQ